MNKCGIFKKNKNQVVNKILSLSLAASIPFSLSSCTKNANDKKEKFIDIDNDNNYSEENYNYYGNDEDFIKLINDNNFFTNKKNYYQENSNQDLNATIYNLLSCKYESSSSFNEDEIYRAVRDEANNILNKKMFYPKNIGSNYSWLIDDTVDREKLKEKLVSNCNNFGVGCNSKIMNMINSFLDNYDVIVQGIKKSNPNYNFSMLYKNLDNLYFIETEEDCIGFYNNSRNCIAMNFQNINSDKDLKLAIIHEMNHFSLNNAFHNEEVSFCGTSMDDLSTIETPFSLTFLSEYLSEKVACDNCNELNTYQKEEAVIKKICFSTNSTVNDIDKCFKSCNQNSFIELFEPEMQNMYYSYGTLYAMDLAMDYGYMNPSFDYKQDCYNFALTNLLKNYFVALLKDYEKGIIDKNDFNNKFEEIINYFENLDYEYQHTNSYYDFIESSRNIINKYVNNKYR